MFRTRKLSRFQSRSCSAFSPHSVRVPNENGSIDVVNSLSKVNDLDVELPPPETFSIDASLAAGKNLDQVNSLVLEERDPVNVQTAGEIAFAQAELETNNEE